MSFTRLGNGFYLVRDFTWDNRYVCIRREVVEALLDDALGLSQNFGRDDVAGNYVRSQLRRFFVYSDAVYCSPYPAPPLYEMLGAWDAFMRSEGVEYIPSVFDCDDFARLFAEFLAWRYGISTVGRLWGLLIMGGSSALHAFNWLIYPNYVDPESMVLGVTVVVVEPQVAAAMLPGEGGEARLILSDGEYVYRSYAAFG